MIPDEQLNNLAKELFHVFSRMEYSLKATGYNNGDGAAKANWRKFALDIEKLIANPNKIKTMGKIILLGNRAQIKIDGTAIESDRTIAHFRVRSTTRPAMKI